MAQMTDRFDVEAASGLDLVGCPSAQILVGILLDARFYADELCSTRGIAHPVNSDFERLA